MDGHRDGEHGIRNAVSINVMARWRDRGENEQLGDHFINYINV